MTSPLARALAPPSKTVARGYGLLGVASTLLWAGVAFAAHGSALGGATLLAALVSVAWLVWALRARHRMRIARTAASADCATVTALVDASLTGDVAAVLAHSATLLHASRAWLRVESPMVARHLEWPASPAAPVPPWWQDALAERSLWLSDAHAPARWAVSLRLHDVRIGVLAFERDDGAQPASARDGKIASAVATLMTHLLLCQHLEARLDELGEQQMRERRMFLANLSHKLRTPMTAILGFAQILALDDSLVGEQREYVREIETAGHTLLELLNELVGIP